jgi:CHAD domain-containing protein
VASDTNRLTGGLSEIGGRLGKTDGRIMTHQWKLRDPVARAARTVGQSFLADARAAETSLLDSDRHRRTVTDEALHDFRVATRRLRSWQRAFTPWLGKAASRKMRRRLRAIARATSASRDTVVQLAWLKQQRRTMSARQRSGVDDLIAYLKEQQPSHTVESLTAAHDFHALSARLGRRLKRSGRATRARSAADQQRFSVVAARLVSDASRALRQRLASVHTASDETAVHKARIAVKRLRYLMEPIVRAHDDSRRADGERLIGQLTQLQDLLGDLHDAHVLALIVVDAEPSPGMLGIARRLRGRRMRSFAAIEPDWLGGGVAPFFDDLRWFCGELVGTNRRRDLCDPA